MIGTPQDHMKRIVNGEDSAEVQEDSSEEHFQRFR